VSIQTQTRVGGTKVRRNKNLTEINFYDAENDEINVQDVYQWQAETDEFLRMSNSNTLDEIRFDRGWTRATLEEELFKREAVLAYLIENGLNTYTQVAATVQAFINDEETILALMANDQLERSLEDLREMESVLIDIDPEKEAMVPRPDPNEAGLELCADILDRAETELFEEYRGEAVPGIDAALTDVDAAADVTASPSSPPPSAEADGEGGPALEDAGPDADAGEDAAGTVDLDGSPFDAEPDTGNDSTVGASSGDDGFDISFDDGPADEPSADADLDWGSSTPDDGAGEASTDDPFADAGEEPAAEDESPVGGDGVSTDDGDEMSLDETDDVSTDDSLDDGDDEPAADMDEWGFGDVTDADEGE
jgi:flagellar protein FlaI